MNLNLLIILNFVLEYVVHFQLIHLFENQDFVNVEKYYDDIVLIH